MKLAERMALNRILAASLTEQLRDYLDTVRDAAVRCKGKAEVASQCDADTEEAKAALGKLYSAMSAVVQTVDAQIGALANLETLMTAKPAAKK